MTIPFVAYGAHTLAQGLLEDPVASPTDVAFGRDDQGKPQTGGIYVL